MREIELELESQPGASHVAGLRTARQAQPAPPSSGAAASPAPAVASGEADGNASAALGGREEEDLDWPDRSDGSQGDEGSAEEGLAGGSQGDAGGDYDLRRFFRDGRPSASPSTSTSKGEGEGAAYSPAGQGGSDSRDGPDG